MSNNKKRKAKSSSGFIYLITALIAVLLFVGLIGYGGFIGSIISSFMFGLMGRVYYLFPFFLLFCSIFFLIRRNEANLKYIVSFAVLFVLVSLFCELVSMIGEDIINNPIEAFEDGKLFKTGGGFIGGCFSFALCEAIGKVGAFIVTIFGFIIIFFIISGKSVFDLIPERKPRQKRKKRPRKESVVDYDEELDDYDSYDTNYDENKKSVINQSVRESFAANSNSDRTKRFENQVSGIDFNSVKVDYNNPRVEENKPSISEENNVIDDIPIIEDISILESEPELPAIEDISGFLDVDEFEKKDILEHDQVNDVSEIPLPPIPIPKDYEPKPIELDVVDELPQIDILNVKEDYEDNHQDEEPEDNIDEVSIKEPEVEIDEISIEEPEVEIDEISIEEPEVEIDEISIEEPEVEIDEISIEEPEIEIDKISIEEPDNRIGDINIEESKGIIEPVETEKPYIYPSVDLLIKSKESKLDSDESLNETANKLVNTLANFGVDVSLSDFSRGPAVTRYEIIPSTGTKVAKILNLQDDIKLNLAAADIRMEAPIPGKSAIGIEVPNKNVEMVRFRNLIESDAFKNTKSPIAFGTGKDLSGDIIISDIAKMPHVLIAGATGSGKSVCINTIIMSILFKASPEEVNFIMIDPKVVELSIYNGIPHLITPVVSDPKKAAGALYAAVAEMNLRYRKFAEIGTRDMAGYNKKITSDDFDGDRTYHVHLPHIVVIVDELADLMMVAKSEVEENICRLAQLARAAGIHLIIATQRPSVDVITGLIKANMPSRIAFAVTSGVDSRTILDMNGAEKLLGKGDMLYFPQGNAKPIRVQGAFVSDDEVMAVAEFIKTENKHVKRTSELSKQIELQMSSQEIIDSSGNNTNPVEDGKDEYFEAAGRLIIEMEKGSIGMLQRKLKVGFNRAARIMDQLAEAGVVGPEEGTKPRKILVTIDEFEKLLNEEL